MIPRTLADVAEWAARGESFDLPLREFLDGFYANPTVEALIPCGWRTWCELGAIEDAYLAATAEWLAWSTSCRRRGGRSSTARCATRGSRLR